MSNTLKSNWMGHKDSAPQTFRAASNGKIFTRTERLRMIFGQKERQERKNKAQELILQERSKAKEQSAARQRYFESVKTLQEHPDAKVRHSANGLYIQPRQNGAFGKKITL